MEVIAAALLEALCPGAISTVIEHRRAVTQAFRQRALESAEPPKR